MWYIRAEWARDHEVLHPQRDVLDKFGGYASRVTSLPPGGLYGVQIAGMDEIGWPRRETRRQTEKTNFILKPRRGLLGERSPVNAMQESAEGIIGGKEQAAGAARRDELGTRPVEAKEQVTETLGLNGWRRWLWPLLKA